MSNQFEAILATFSEFRRTCPLQSYDLPLEELLPIEHELSNLWPQIRTLSDSQLTNLRSSIDLHYAVIFDRYARRIASAAVRQSSKTLLLHALTALSMDENLLDDRDLYRTGVILIDSSNRIHVDTLSLYREGLKAATASRRSLLERQLLTAPNYMRSLKSMRISIQEDQDRFTYVDGLFEWPTPIDERRVSETIEKIKHYEQGKSR